MIGIFYHRNSAILRLAFTLAYLQDLMMIVTIKISNVVEAQAISDIKSLTVIDYVYTTVLLLVHQNS